MEKRFTESERNDDEKEQHSKRVQGTNSLFDLVASNEHSTDPCECECVCVYYVHHGLVIHFS